MAILIFRSGVTLSDLGEDIINYHFARSKVKTPVILYFKYHGNMDITIKIHKGKSIKLSVNATDSIKFIKLMIQDQENYHKDVQKLYLTIENNLQNENELENHKRLNDYPLSKIIQNGLILLIPFQVKIKKPDGNFIMFFVCPTDTVSNVKTKIFEKEGIRQEYQRLYHSGKSMIDSLTLEDQDISEEVTIDLIC